MFAIKRELKLNNVETSLMRGNAGFKRWVYNFGLDLLTASWSFPDVRLSDSKRLDAIKKVFTQVRMEKAEYAWMRLYPSTVYQSAFIDLKQLNNSKFKNSEVKSITWGQVRGLVIRIPVPKGTRRT
ncbi:MAG: hypothetical protein ACYT04_51030 [Nostoc sp.]